jgi:hypothetical protein
MSPPAPNHNIPAGQLTNGGCRTSPKLLCLCVELRGFTCGNVPITPTSVARRDLRSGYRSVTVSASLRRDDHYSAFAM